MAEVAGAAELLALCGRRPGPDRRRQSTRCSTRSASRRRTTRPSSSTSTSRRPTSRASLALWITSPIQEKWIASPNATEAANYVSSGPFMLTPGTTTAEIILKPNPNWSGAIKPTLTEIQMSMITEPAQAQAAYEAGELDMVAHPERGRPARQGRSGPWPGGRRDPAARDHLLRLQQRHRSRRPSSRSRRCADLKACPTMNKDFRIALTQAIDKKAFIDATFAAVGEPANSFVMPGIPGYQADLDPYPFDLAAAKASMDQGARRDRRRQTRLTSASSSSASTPGPATSPASRSWPRPGDRRSVSRPSRSAATSASSSSSARPVST